ncbi:MAG: hypothetical protein DRJ07_03605, partial [Bacteroidetes bacterium]
YHFLLYFQHKDKAYLYYSSYTLLIFIGLLNRPTNGFIVTLIEPFKEILDHLSLSFILNYNLIYFLFFLTILDLKTYSIKWNSFVLKSVYILFSLSILIEIGYQFTDNIQIITKGHFIFMVATYLLGFIILIPMVMMNNPLKYYIIIGSLFLVITSLFVTIIKRLDLSHGEIEIRYSVFYFGLIFENILFSLALGAKQKNILHEKNASQEKLIKQLKENEKLKIDIQEQLEQNVAELSKQAEEDKIEKIKTKYDKELTELKMSSLRNQMNPHFIFNSLNSIKLYIINNEKENAVYYLNKFSKLIRKILATTQEKEITLADEIETMQLYLKIENIRFNNAIVYNVSIDKNVSINTIKIPCLILQPFLENALWHGLSLKKDLRKLDIIIETSGSTHITINIIDNGIGREKSQEIKEQKMLKRKSIGIKLTEERLKNFFKDYQNSYALSFTDLYDKDNKPEGTKVVIWLPLI